MNILKCFSNTICVNFHGSIVIFPKQKTSLEYRSHFASSRTNPRSALCWDPCNPTCAPKELSVFLPDCASETGLAISSTNKDLKPDRTCTVCEKDWCGSIFDIQPSTKKETGGSRWTLVQLFTQRIVWEMFLFKLCRARAKLWQIRTSRIHRSRLPPLQFECSVFQNWDNDIWGHLEWRLCLSLLRGICDGICLNIWIRICLEW